MSRFALEETYPELPQPWKASMANPILGVEKMRPLLAVACASLYSFST